MTGCTIYEQLLLGKQISLLSFMFSKAV